MIHPLKKMILSLYINNKHGSLVFHKDLAAKARQLSSNEIIVAASTFHGMSRIAASLARVEIDPIPGVPLKKRGDLIGLMQVNHGITLIQSARHKMVCYETPTGLQILCVSDLASPTVSQCRQYLEQVYQLYADCITKNPLCDPEMPIRLPFFEELIVQLTNQV